MTCSEYFIRNS